MSTRSIIAYGTIKELFPIFPCTTAHFDGNPENMLPILREHFNDSEKSYELTDQAPFSGIKSSGEIFGSWADKPENPCLFSGKDQFENLTEAAKYFWDTAYAYIFDQDSNSWHAFKISMTEEREITPLNL